MCVYWAFALCLFDMLLVSFLSHSEHVNSLSAGYFNSQRPSPQVSVKCVWGQLMLTLGWIPDLHLCPVRFHTLTHFYSCRDWWWPNCVWSLMGCGFWDCALLVSDLSWIKCWIKQSRSNGKVWNRARWSWGHPWFCSHSESGTLVEGSLHTLTQGTVFSRVQTVCIGKSAI